MKLVENSFRGVIRVSQNVNSQRPNTNALGRWAFADAMSL